MLRNWLGEAILLPLRIPQEPRVLLQEGVERLPKRMPAELRWLQLLQPTQGHGHHFQRHQFIHVQRL